MFMEAVDNMSDLLDLRQIAARLFSEFRKRMEESDGLNDSMFLISFDATMDPRRETCHMYI